jgi:glycosyltransferase involved in cell wall biosynthesis
MKIVLHDYGGYAFIVGLARRLAGRGHDVFYLHAAHNPTPHGQLDLRPSDPPGFHSQGLTTNRTLHKDQLINRWRQETAYGSLLAAAVTEIAPDVILSANTPIDAQSRLQRSSRRHGIPLVYWVQDLIGPATTAILAERLGPLGRVVGAWYARRERDLVAGSSAAVVIAEPFREHLLSRGVRDVPIKVIPNWAPIDALPRLPKVNDWSQAQGLSEHFCYLYSGTLGMKHDLAPVLALAEVAEDQGAILAVVSQGPAAERLLRLGKAQGLGSLRLIPFQPMDVYHQVLATGDVLVGILEARAAAFSVPSKIYSYLCAGRPILMNAPLASPSARLVIEAEVGLAVDPGDTAGWRRAAQRLFGDESLRAGMGQRAREYAERIIDLDAVTNRFERILEDVTKA